MVVMCKVCLTSNVRIYSIEHSHLEELYEKLTCDNKGDPSLGVLTVCYICFSQLKRCFILSALAKESKRWLRNLYNRDIEVSQEIIMKLNTGRNNFSITNLPSLTITNDVDKVNEPVSIKEEIIEHEYNTLIEDEDTQINLSEVNENQSISLDATGEESVVTEYNTPDKQPKTHKNTQVNNQIKANVKKEFKEEYSIPVKHEDVQIKDSEIITPRITPLKVENIIDDNINKITRILQELKVIIEEATPALLADYKCQIQRFEEYRKNGGVKKLRLPKKRFSWCLRSLGLLARLKVLAGSEKAGIELLRERVLPLFPKGFARMPTLLKMSGYKPQRTNSDNKRRKTSH